MPIPEKYYKTARTDPRLSQCLHCGYDLSGSPEGKCPECGRAFTFAELRRVFIKRKTPTPMSHALARVCIVTQCALVLTLVMLRVQDGYEESAFLSILLCLTCFAWWMLRAVETQIIARHERVWWLLPMVGLGAAYFAPHGAGYAVALVVPLLVPVARLLCRDSDRQEVLLRLSGLVALICCPVAIWMLASIPSGGTWSDWPDFRPGQAHRQYPLTVDELQLIALLLGTYGLVSGGVFSIAATRALIKWVKEQCE